MRTGHTTANGILNEVVIPDGDEAVFVGSPLAGRSKAAPPVRVRPVEERTRGEPFLPTWENRPPDTPPLLTFQGAKLGAPGGLATFVAGAGLGKSGVCEAILAHRLNPRCDALGLAVTTDRPVVYVDTERSREELWSSWHRVMQRAGLKKPEDGRGCVHFAGIKTLSTLDERRAYVRQEIERLDQSIVILDSIADLLRDVNDGPDCAAYVMELLALAETRGLLVVVTLHINPNSEKARGHLGSEVWRRGGAVLYIRPEVDGSNVRTITSSGMMGKVRHGPQLAGYFTWDAAAGMFVTCTPEDGAVLNRRTELAALARKAYSGSVSLGYTELVAAVSRHTGKKERTCKGLVSDLVALNLVVKDIAPGSKRSRYLLNANESELLSGPVDGHSAM